MLDIKSLSLKRQTLAALMTLLRKARVLVDLHSSDCTFQLSSAFQQTDLRLIYFDNHPIFKTAYLVVKQVKI